MIGMFGAREGDMRLGIGTAQFGLDYGLSNRNGRVCRSEVDRILDTSRRHGVRYIDTAAAYGISEEVLGMALPARHDFRIVTKVSGWKDGQSSPQFLKDTFRRSLDRMRCDSVYGLLLHDLPQFGETTAPDLFEALEELKSQGLATRIGGSVYSSCEIEMLLGFGIDLIQLPLSVLDQRWPERGVLERLVESKVEIHARSVFLQGLLFIDPGRLGCHFDSAKPLLRRFHDDCERAGVGPVEAALAYALGLPELDCVIVGTTCASEWQQVLQADLNSARALADYREYSCRDPAILNPSLWPVRKWPVSDETEEAWLSCESH